MPTLDDYFALANGIKAFYEAPDGLQRRPGEFNIPEVANWLYHGIEHGHTLKWIKQAIRVDAAGEWRSKHPGEDPGGVPAEGSGGGEPNTGGGGGTGNGGGAPIQTGRLLPVTNASDGRIIPREYAYWSNCWIAGGAYYVFCGTSNGPQFYAVDRQSGNVTRFGNLAPVGGETEGWFWLRDGSLVVLAGSRLLRIQPLAPREPEVLIDLEALGHPGCDLWQPHASEDGSTFSATVRRIVSDGKYPNIGTITMRRGTPFYISAEGDLDESHLSGDGRYIICEEKRNWPGNDNRIINLDTRDTRWITDADGALSHIDCGPDYMVGEADRPDPQCCARIQLDGSLTLSSRVDLFHTSNMGHVSVAGGRCLLSDATHLSLVDLNGNGVTPLIEHGMVGSDYDRQVKANWDPTGQVVCFRSNRGTDRDDLFILEVPR